MAPRFISGIIEYIDCLCQIPLCIILCADKEPIAVSGGPAIRRLAATALQNAVPTGPCGFLETAASDSGDYVTLTRCPCAGRACRAPGGAHRGPTGSRVGAPSSAGELSDLAPPASAPGQGGVRSAQGWTGPEGPQVLPAKRLDRGDAQGTPSGGAVIELSPAWFLRMIVRV